MNWFNKTIAVISPRLAAERAMNEVRLQNLEYLKTRAYDGANKSARTAGWSSSGTSARTETQSAIVTLRNRSREMVRNNANAKKAIRVIANNTIGTGIRPSPIGTALQVRKVKAMWREWAESTACDFDGLNTFYGLQKLIMTSVAESGECIVIKKIKKDGVIPFQLQVLEADYIDSNKTILKSGGGSIVNGVDYDSSGRRIGFWLFDQHPGDFLQKNIISKFYSVDDVLHIFYCERPSQHRGVPWGHSVMLKLQDFGEYEDAELLKQKVSACFAAFYTDGSEMSQATDKTPMSERIQPGIIEHMPTGSSVTFANPPSKEGYRDYTATTLQQVAAGFGITYEAISGNFKEVNFSSGRMGWLEMARQILDWQENMMIPLFCNPVWKWFTEGASIMGAKVGTVNWSLPRREMIDPVKEMEGLKTAIRLGLLSWPEAIRQQGYEPDEVLEEITEYTDKFAERGLQLDADPRYDKGKVLPLRNDAPNANNEEEISG